MADKRPLKAFISTYSKPNVYFPAYDAGRFVPVEVEILSHPSGYQVYAKYEDPERNRVTAITTDKKSAQKAAKEYIRAKILNTEFLS